MKIEKVEKLVANLYDKTEYIIRIRNLKQALNLGLVLKKVHRVIKFNQKAWLKSYIDRNTDLRRKAKTDFEKYFFKLMNNSVSGKTMYNGRKHRDVKLVTTRKRRTIFSRKMFSYRNEKNSNIDEYTKRDDIYKDIVEDVETRFDTSNYELDRPLQKGKNKNIIGLMKDILGGKIMIKFVGLSVKT